MCGALTQQTRVLSHAHAPVSSFVGCAAVNMFRASPPRGTRRCWRCTSMSAAHTSPDLHGTRPRPTMKQRRDQPSTVVRDRGGRRWWQGDPHWMPQAWFCDGIASNLQHYDFVVSDCLHMCGITAPPHHRTTAACVHACPHAGSPVQPCPHVITCTCTCAGHVRL